MRRSILSLLSVLVLASPAQAAVTFEFLFDEGFPTAISFDGSAIAGNTADGAYEPFRWTRSGGFQRLGMSAAEAVGSSGGVPGISGNGLWVASTVPSPDSAYYTQGLWTEGGGWQTLMPPVPPGAGQLDRGLASVDDLSGDGTTVVGLVWLPIGKAHASAWTQAGGPVDLGATPGRSSRAKGVNYDGSVIVGWDESVSWGARSPAVWVNGQRTNLAPEHGGEVWCSTLDGQTIGGFQRDSTNQTKTAAIWRRVGDGWSPTQFINLIPGTSPSGNNSIGALSSDGKFGVGWCSWDGSAFDATGLMWSESTGAIDVAVFLAMNGVFVDPNFTINELTCMTPDGTKIAGYGRNATPPYTVRAFMIHLDPHLLAVEADAGPRVALAAVPNPLQAGTTLSFTLAHEESGALTVHDSAGRLVRRLLDGTFAAGPYSVRWDSRDESGAKVAPGIYFMNLVAGSTRESKKLVVVD